jgi:hypothetical protein
VDQTASDQEIFDQAKKWVNLHPPFYIVDTGYGVNAFTAGYEAAMNEWAQNERGEM